jgi:hypothetical protein
LLNNSTKTHRSLQIVECEVSQPPGGGSPAGSGEPVGSCTAGGACHSAITDGGGLLGLSPIKQSFINTGKRANFRNRNTGEVLSYDVGWMRYNRMRKAVKAWAGLNVGKEAQLAMITLTYRPGEDYQADDKRDFIQKLRRGLNKRLLGYAWVAELQRRGVIHYHLLLYVIKGTNIPHPDEVGWWIHGLTTVTNRIRTPFYLLKYVGKEYQKDFDKFPSGIRAFAVVLTDQGEKMQLRLIRLPPWAIQEVINRGWGELENIRKEHRKESGWYFTGVSNDKSPPKEICQEVNKTTNLCLSFCGS